MLECVVNVSEGRDRTVLERCAAACGDALLDLHVDVHHNRSVFTLVGVDAPRALAVEVVGRLDLRTHQGVHPRIGVLDVVPFVALDGSTATDAVSARDEFGDWAGSTLALPCFRYGDERSLPDVRRGAFTTLAPDAGPSEPHPSAGACAIGARPVMLAYNVWVDAPDAHAVRRTASAIRGPVVRSLALDVGGRWQVSSNLIDPAQVGPRELVDLVSARGAEHGVTVIGTELVGLLPESVLDRVDASDRERLDLGVERTIEWRLRHGRR